MGDKNQKTFEEAQLKIEKKVEGANEQIIAKLLIHSGHATNFSYMPIWNKADGTLWGMLVYTWCLNCGEVLEQIRLPNNAIDGLLKARVWHLKEGMKQE